MKKNFIKKLSFALAALLLISAIFTVSTFATVTESDIDTSFVEWELSNDSSTLYNPTTNTTYTYYDPGINIRPIAKNIFVYSAALDYGYYYTSYVESNLSYKDVVWVDTSYEYLYYATESGRIHMESFIGGKVGSYHLVTGFRYSEIDVHMIGSLNQRGTVVSTMDVRNLKNYICYEIEAWDSSASFAYTYGVIYDINGEYWFLNYNDLGNQYFDANGNFSFRKGTVDLVKLSNSLKNEVDTHLSLAKYRYSDYSYEADEEPWETEGFFMVLFWICFVIYGFILPLPFVAIGLILAFNKRLGRPRYWIIVSALALLWMLFAAILAIVIIVVLLI